MGRRTCIGVFICLIFFFVSIPGYAADRVALVIGNADYRSAPLRNPVNDARDMAKVLRALKFDVIERLNADKKEMVEAIDEFYEGLKRADMGLFYFAGHGMQIQGLNYLIPVEAHVHSETDVEFEAVHAGRVLGKMDEAGNKLNIVILDACRDNPFKRSFRTERKGLAQMDAPIGTIVAYSTSPGSVAADGDGRNGIYTKHLLKHIARNDLSVSDVFREAGLGVMEETKAKQVPWTSSTPVREYYLASSGWGEERPAQKTSLTIRCNVDSALVMVDGTPVGHTPLEKHPVNPGEHRIVVQKSGHEAYRDTVEVGKGRSLTLRVMLDPAGPRKARLFVDTEPSGAKVRILNISPGFYQGIDLNPGRYHVEVTADKHETWEKWVTLDAGEDRRLEVVLKPLVDKTRGTVTNALGMTFIRIPSGEFMMGSKLSPAEVEERYGGKEKYYKDEHPRHRVKISKPFYLQDKEVTVGQWRRFVKETGYKTEAETGGGAYSFIDGKWQKKEGRYWDSPGFSQTDAHPVTCVSWNDAQAFIKWLNKKGMGTYRLPNEAEWEYAARAGSDTVFFWGNDGTTACKYANIADETCCQTLSASGCEDCDDGFAYTAPVGRYRPNAWGLFDMTGNVWEWCHDRYGDYPSGMVTDPTGPSSGAYRVFRGGSWDLIARYCRSADRGRVSPGYRYISLGFRLARTH